MDMMSSLYRNLGLSGMSSEGVILCGLLCCLSIKEHMWCGYKSIN